MNRLNRIGLDKRGIMTTEAAILVPMMLVGLCIVLAFMFIFYKWGASQLIFDHVDMSARLGVEPRYSFEMLEDSRTTTAYKAKEKNHLNEVKVSEHEAQVIVTPPYLQESKQLYFKNKHFSLSYQREVQMAHWLKRTLN